jgi:hypothetical protein
MSTVEQDTPEEDYVKELEGGLSLKEELSPAVLDALVQAGPDVSIRVRRCMRIVEKIDRKAVRILGDEHLAHLMVVERMLGYIGLATEPPSSLTPAMAVHLEEMFVLTQPNYQLDDEQKKVVREFCAVHNTPVSEEN